MATKKFDVWNQTGYLKYRLNILATVSSGVQPSIDEFELFEKTDNELVISNEMNEDYFANYGSSGELSKFNSAIKKLNQLNPTLLLMTQAKPLNTQLICQNAE